MDYARRRSAISGMVLCMNDDWTDLDQAYLEIFGEHPDLDRPAADVVPITSSSELQR